MATVKYLAEIAFKLDWQSWLPLPGANGVFYDTTKENNGLNKNSSRYSNKQGFDLFLVMEADVSVGVNGPVTRYRRISPACRALDYDESAVDPRQWDVEITLKDSDGNDIGTSLNTGTKMTMEAVWTISSGTLPAIPYAIHRIQGVGGGINIYELSSLRANLASGPNPLLPIVGETLLKVEIVNSTTIKTSCRIDGTLLVKGSQYSISARIGDTQLDFNTPAITLDNIVPNTVTGITSFDLTIDEGHGVENNLDSILILVYRTDTSDLLETLTGNNGDAFGDMESDLGSGSVKDYITGTLANGESLQFNKYNWAVATGRTNVDAVELRFDATITNNQTGLTSPIGSGTFTVETKDGTDY